MDPLTALSVCSGILQIVDFSCKILSKGNELRASFSGSLPENEVLEKVVTHLQGLVDQLRRPGQNGGASLKGMVELCLNTTGELLEVLEKLRVHGSKTRWKSFRAAVKSVWRKEKVEELLERLKLIRDEIEFGTIIDMREELVKLSLQQTTRFDSLDHSTQAVLQAILKGQSASATASTTQNRVIEDMNLKLERLIINEHQQTRNEILDEIRQQTAQFSTTGGFVHPYLPQVDPSADMGEKTDILVMLKFQAIDDRHSAIPENHRHTFAWIWSDESQGIQIWGNFWQWLTMGRGIYWVTGKAGSGKSTLMKYIYHDDRTSQGLRYWSNGIEVVTAAYFFWNSGSSMQKSLLGLLQSLLHEVLERKPELKEEVFPSGVQEEVSKRWKTRPPESDTIWTVQDLKSAFTRLLQRPNLKICLFVDGLDEFDGEHSDIAELFQSILASSSVKACLSSRPLVTFEHSFATCPRLRLQDLTYEDISLYVREKLEDREEVLRMSLAEPSDFQELIEEIIVKASGVFLWVTLVVRSLLDGLTNYDRMADLRLRLKEIPDDLSHLYWHMLQGIKPAFYLGQAAKLLRIMYTAYSEKLTLEPRDLAVAEEYEPGNLLQQISKSSYSGHNVARGVLMEGRLVSRCRGLLEVQQGKVAFIHLSVLEFLKIPDVITSLNERIQGPFNPYASMLAALLTDIENSGDHDHYDMRGQQRIETVLHLARKAELEFGSADITLVSEIDRVYRKHLERHACLDDTAWNWRKSDLSWAGLVAHCNNPRPLAWDDTFVSLSLQRGLVQYVSTVLDKGESMHQGPRGRPLLDFVVDLKCVYFWTALRGEPKKVLELCSLLLERGADPNETIRGKSVWENLLSHANSDFPFADAASIENFTITEERLGDFAVDYTYEDDNGTKYKYDCLPKHWIWLELMDLFLKFGADPSAGLVASTMNDFDQIKPVANFVLEEFVPSHRKRANELYHKIKSLGGVRTTYLRPSRPRLNALVWDLLPHPRPEDIPGPGPRHSDLRDWTPKAKLNKLSCPDYEGMIPTSTEPALRNITHASPMQQPYPQPSVAQRALDSDQQQSAPKKSIYSQLMKFANGVKRPVQPPVQQQPSPPFVYTHSYLPTVSTQQQGYPPSVSGSNTYLSTGYWTHAQTSNTASSSPVPSYSQPYQLNTNHSSLIQQNNVPPLHPLHPGTAASSDMYHQTTQTAYLNSSTANFQSHLNPTPTPSFPSPQHVPYGNSIPQAPHISNYAPVYQTSRYVPLETSHNNSMHRTPHFNTGPAPPVTQPSFETHTPPYSNPSNSHHSWS